MLVSDIYEDCKEVLGFAHQEKIFSRISDAIEALANKGSWEPLLAYLVIATVNRGSNLVLLPDIVEVPLRVTLDYTNPAFSRGRMYEFTMNGPGETATKVEWSWEDLGEARTITADESGNVTGDGRNTKRVIRISKNGAHVRMLVRLRTSKVTSMSDFIPLHSKLSILMMLKALESYRKGSPQDFQLAQGQEAQALKFLSEEQQSRGTYQDLATALDKPSIIGYKYNSANLVIVSDIYDEAAMICGGVGRSHVFDAITEAIECLANKSQWDAMTLYLVMSPNSDLIGLPGAVETPIRINIEDKPAMARSRLYEFTVNGPGTNLGKVSTLTWEDQGFGPLQLPLTSPAAIAVRGSPADNGVSITVSGYNEAGLPHVQVYRIHEAQDSPEPEIPIPEPPQPEPPDVPDPDAPDPEIPTAPVIWREIVQVTKPVTHQAVRIFSGGIQRALYAPEETLPAFRQIKLSKVASNIRIMYRRSSIKINAITDIIPLKSRSAILNMMRSLQLYKAPDLSPDKIQMAQALEANALKYLQEEEQSRLAYINASAKDIMPAYGINTHSRGVVTAQDVYDDACDIFGPIGTQRIFDKITEGMEMLANKSQWDGLDGYVDILADQRGYLTLPRKVEVPVGLNFCGDPAQMQSRWYEFHMNGLGGRCEPRDTWVDVGEYPLINEPQSPARLYAITDFPSDADADIRAYGYNPAGTWIRTLEGDEWVDGEKVPVSVRQTQGQQTVPVTVHKFMTVTRISKDQTDKHIELWGGYTNYEQTDFTAPPVVDQQNEATPHFLAIYDAEETEPMFRRLKIPTWVTWVRMRYRMSTRKITDMSDVLNMRSKTAIVTMLRYLKALEAGDLNAAQGYEAVATKLISEEQMTRNPAETFDLQFDQRVCFADPLQGQF